MKSKRGFLLLLGVLLTWALILPSEQCWSQGGAADQQAKLEKIKQGKPSEAEVKSLLGEPKKIKTFTKARMGGHELHEIAALYYDIGGKEVRIFVHRTLGYVTKVSE